MEYIDTQFGKLHLSQLPVVAPEPLDKKFMKSMLFFSFIIICLLFILYLQWNVPHNAKMDVTDRMNLKTVKTDVNATSIHITNVVSKHPVLENIVILTKDGNMLNFRPSVLQKGYKVDFGESLDITEITLITGKSPCNYITNLDIALYNVTHNGEIRVWEYSGPLMDKSENTIYISKMYYDMDSEILDEPLADKDNYSSNKSNKSNKPNEKMISIENELAISLTEHDEKYVSY